MSSQATAPFSSDRPVLVIGGGISGLTTAWELQQRGVPVKVIEASRHLGGRIHTVEEGAGRIETGMQFYYGGYKHAKRLLKRFGLLDDLVPIDVRGLMYWDGDLHPFSKSRPWLTAMSATDNFRLYAKMASKLAPFLGHSTFHYAADEGADSIDVAEYFTRHGDETMLELVARPMVNSYAFCEPEGHSLSMLLRIMKLGAFSGTNGLRRGNDSLPRAMAAELDVVHARAREVVIDDGRVEAVVLDRDGVEETVAASTVVLAVNGRQAGGMLGGVPSIAKPLGELSYSSVVLANLHLDRPLEGPDWVYVMSRKAEHQSAFAIDLKRRSPTMFGDDNSVLQVNFATPVTDALLESGASDDAIVKQSIEDLRPFIEGIEQMVTESSVVRRPSAHPNFTCGMFKQVREIQAKVGAIGGLHLAGDYLRSPLCESAVRSGIDAAEGVCAAATRRRPVAEREAARDMQPLASRA